MGHQNGPSKKADHIVQCNTGKEQATFATLRQNSTCSGNKTPYLKLYWWFSGKDSFCRCRRHGFNPWYRKIPHAVEQLSPWATTPEPTCCNHWASVPESLCSAPREAAAVRSRHIATRERPSLSSTRGKPTHQRKTEPGQRQTTTATTKKPNSTLA